MKATSFIVESTSSHWSVAYVVAPSGYRLQKDGSLQAADDASPEMGHWQEAHRFSCRIMADQTASSMHDAVVHSINY